MRKLRRLWKALEAPYGVVGVCAHLAQVFGEELSFAEPFLRRLPEPSEVYPCPYPGGPGCPRRVIHRRDGSIVAVCGCDPAECDEVPLQPEDIVAYELAPGLVSKSLARVLGFTASPCKLAGRHDIWNAGFFTDGGAARLPVFLVLAASRRGLQSAIDHLLAEYDSAFIVLVPTLRFVDASLDKRLQRRQSKLIVLENALVAVDGKLVALESLATSMGLPVEAALAPQPRATTGRVRVPRSAGSPQAVRAVMTYMQERGWGITQFATQAGTTDRTLRKFLKSSKMRRSSFEAMAERMGLSTEQLLRGELPSKNQQR